MSAGDVLSVYESRARTYITFRVSSACTCASRSTRVSPARRVFMLTRRTFMPWRATPPIIISSIQRLSGGTAPRTPSLPASASCVLRRTDTRVSLQREMARFATVSPFPSLTVVGKSLREERSWIATNNLSICAIDISVSISDTLLIILLIP